MKFLVFGRIFLNFNVNFFRRFGSKNLQKNFIGECYLALIFRKKTLPHPNKNCMLRPMFDNVIVAYSSKRYFTMQYLGKEHKRQKQKATKF